MFTQTHHKTHTTQNRSFSTIKLKPPSLFQVLQLGLPVLLQKEGGTVQNNMGWKTKFAAVSSQSDKEPKIQHYYIPPHPSLQSIQILPQFIFPDNGL